MAKAHLKKFVAKRWFDRDLAGVLTGPFGARWAAPHRLPLLPVGTRASAPPAATRAAFA